MAANSKNMLATVTKLLFLCRYCFRFNISLQLTIVTTQYYFTNSDKLRKESHIFEVKQGDSNGL